MKKLLFLFMLMAGTVLGQNYDFVILPEIGDYAYAYDINNAGDIVGTSGNYACIWQNQSITVLPDFIGESAATALNDYGQIVGCAVTAEGYYHATLWENDQIYDLGCRSVDGNAAALDINNLGQAIGWSTMTGFQDWKACLWLSDFTLIELGTLGGNMSEARGINDAEQIVGRAEDSNGDMWAFIIDPVGGEWFLDDNSDGINDLMTVIDIPDAISSVACRINEFGEISGDYYDTTGHWCAFIWSAENGAINCDNTGNYASHVMGMSNNGMVCGYTHLTEHAPYYSAFRYDGNISGFDAIFWDSTYWNLEQAMGINDSGQIIGMTRSGQNYCAFCLSPSEDRFLSEPMGTHVQLDR